VYLYLDRMRLRFRQTVSGARTRDRLPELS